MTVSTHLKRALKLVASQAPRFPVAFTNSERKHYDYLRGVISDDNIVGVGIADKTVAGKAAGIETLTFYVREKRPISDLRGSPQVPPVIAAPGGKAIFTDVFVIGEMLPQANVARSPLRSGFSLSHPAGGAGTLGAIVRRNGRAMLLSNAHVIARSGLAPKGDAVLYPAKSDGGRENGDTVARLFDVVPLEVGGALVNLADAALAEILIERLDDLALDIHGAAVPYRFMDPTDRMKVTLMGRQSGPTTSIVKDLNFHFAMPYPDIGRVGFQQQVRCDPYTAPGDSGAIVVASDSGAIVGLHFAGSAEASAFTPIRTVINLLRFQL